MDAFTFKHKSDSALDKHLCGDCLCDLIEAVDDKDFLKFWVERYEPYGIKNVDACSMREMSRHQ